MKNITKILAGIALVGSMAACTDGNDWDVDGSETGLFRPISPKAEQTAKGETTINYTFTGVPGATGYQIEATTDSATFVASDEVSSDNILIEASNSPVEYDGFNVGKTYYSRIRAISANGKSSWVGISKVKMEEVNLFTDAEATATRIKFIWTASPSVTSIVLFNTDSVELARVELDEEAISTGAYQFDNLNSNTIYIAELYAGVNRCGSYSKSTGKSEAPSGDYNFTYDPTKTMQEQLEAIASQAGEGASYSVTVTIAAETVALLNSHDEETGNDNGSLKIPSGMSVTFVGERSDAKDVVTVVKSISFDGNHDQIVFSNLTVQGQEGAYCVNQSGACNIGTLEFKNCKIQDFTGDGTFIRTQTDLSGVIETFIIDGCIVTNCGQKYSTITVDGASMTNIEISNSTFSGININNGKAFLATNKCKTRPSSVKISDCTFYNLTNNYFLDFKCNNEKGLPATLLMENLLWGKSYTPAALNKFTQADATESNLTNCYATSDCSYAMYVGTDGANDPTKSKLGKIGATVLGASSAVFADPENGDFTLLEGVAHVGDPRWYTSAE